MKNFVILFCLLFELVFGIVYPEASYSSNIIYHKHDISLSVDYKTKIYTYNNFEHDIIRPDTDSEIYSAIIKSQSGIGGSLKVHNNETFGYNKSFCLQNVFITNDSCRLSFIETEIFTRAP